MRSSVYIHEARPLSLVANIAISGLLLGAALYCAQYYLFADSVDISLFPMLVSAFAVYLALECSHYVRKSDNLGLLAPPLLASILHFYLCYVVPTVGNAWDPWIFSRFDNYFQAQWDNPTRVILAISLAAFSMWRGYYFGLGQAQTLRRSLARRQVLRSEFRPALFPVLAIQVMYFSLVFLAAAQGVFGFSTTIEQRAANVELLGFLSIGFAAGSLSFLLLLIHVFRRRAAGENVLVLSIVCFTLVLLNVLVGAISGAKSEIVMPFVMLGFARFIANQKISIPYIAMACLALFLSYQIIEPYRQYLLRNEGAAKGVESLIEGLGEAYEQRDLGAKFDVPLSTQIISRFDLTGFTAVGIAFADNESLKSNKGSEFAESLFLAPALAFIPRFIWPDKPIYASGKWFNQVVLGHPSQALTAVGMGPVTWFYFVGGMLGVILGFLFLGWLQAILFDGFARAGAGGLIVFLAAAQTLVFIPTDVGPELIGILRMLPLAFLAQFFLLQPPQKPVKHVARG